MRLNKRVPGICTCCFLFIILLLSACYKKDIQVGDDLAISHTRIITVDTVTAVLSTYVLDSFATSGNNFALIGNYKDAYVGSTEASTFFQPGLVSLGGDASVEMPVQSSQFDSLVLWMKPSGYFFGDTTKPFSVSLYQLSGQADYSYANRLYNTSYVPQFSTPLVSNYSKVISPNRRDTMTIKLDQALGQAWFTAIQNKTLPFQTEDNFLNFFNGIHIVPNNMSAIYGFNLSDSSVKLRMYYHTTTPYPVAKTADFLPTRTSYQFNRIITDRSNTAIAPVAGKHIQEFFANSQYPYAVMQNGTGVLLKVTFPSLRDLLKISEVTRLMHASLVLKPVNNTFDIYQYKLPSPLYMAATDATNAIGSSLIDSTGSTVESRTPNIDFLYGLNTAYTFNVTSYLNSLISNGGTQQNGFFVMEVDPTTAKTISRGVFGSAQNAQFQTKLVVQLLTID